MILYLLGILLLVNLLWVDWFEFSLGWRVATRTTELSTTKGHWQMRGPISIGSSYLNFINLPCRFLP